MGESNHNVAIAPQRLGILGLKISDHAILHPEEDL